MDTSNDEILNRLIRVRQGFEEILRREGVIPIFGDSHERTETGLNHDEMRAWLANQPAFTKRIVTPINSRRTKRGSDVTLRKVTSS